MRELSKQKLKDQKAAILKRDEKPKDGSGAPPGEESQSKDAKKDD